MRNKDKGYVKLFRCITENIIWDNDEPFDKRSAWIDLIMLANHKDGEFMIGLTKYTVKRGQTWTSIGKLCDRWHWSREKVLRFLNMLQGEGMIWREATNRGQLIFLVNYGDFQDFEGKTRQPTRHQTSQPTSQPIERQHDTKRATKQDTEYDTKHDTNNNDKNDIKNDIKNESKMIKNPFGDSWMIEE